MRQMVSHSLCWHSALSGRLSILSIQYLYAANLFFIRVVGGEMYCGICCRFAVKVDF